MKKFWTVFLISFLMLSQFGFGATKDVDREFEFAQGLIELGFPDYAEEVVDDVVQRNPDQKRRGVLVKVEILAKQRKLEEAKKLAKTLPSDNPKALAAKLVLGDAYYATGEMDAAQEIYTQFFKEHAADSLKDRDLRRIYRDAAYRYGKMQENMDNLEEALKGYENVLKAKPEKDIKRRLQSEMADLYVKLARKQEGEARQKNLKRGEELCNEVLWGGADIWFGNCINTLAQLKMVKGDKKEARETLLEYMDMLQKIDERLEEGDRSLDKSPMAGARFLLGELYESEADRLAEQDKEGQAIKNYGKALNQFVTVYAKYGGSKWADDSVSYVDDITARLEDDFGKEVKVDMGEYRLKAIKSRFRRANKLYAAKKYEEAKNEYLQALNAYPNTSETGTQLARLGVCFVELDDDLAAEMLIDYICERYSDADKAYLGPLMIGKAYFEKKNEEMYLKAYDAYLETFPEHDNVPGVLYTLALAQEKAGNEERADEYLQELVAEHGGSKYYLKALERRGWNAYEEGEYEKAVEAFKKYVEEASPSREKVRMQFTLADALTRMDEFNQARSEFSKLVKWLTPEDNSYGSSAEDEEKNRETLEKAKYYVAYCLAQMEEPKDRLDQIRELALRQLDQFIEEHSDSPRAPKAYNLKGKVFLKMGDSDAAADVYSELASKYPESQAGQGALYQLIKSASEIGEKKVVKESFAKMAQNKDRYSPAQFTRTGEIMMKNGLYENAAEAFQEVLDMDVEERKFKERALFGLGKSRFELGRNSDAIKSLTELMEDYPKSSFFYDTQFLLGRAHREEGNTDAARDALRDVFKYARDGDLRKRADYQLGRTEEAAGNIKKALAAFQRIVMMSNPEDSEIRDTIEKSHLKSIELYNELEQYDKVVDSCNEYLETFPQGDSVEDVRETRRQAKLQ